MRSFRRTRGRPPHPGLFTPAEERLLPFIEAGLTNPEIAARTGLTVNTVHTHVASMLAKSGATDRHQLPKFAPPPSRPRFAWLPALGVPLAGVAAVGVLGIAVLAVFVSSNRGGESPSASPTSSATSLPSATPTEPPPVSADELAARPLHLPVVAPGEACPAETTARVSFGLYGAAGSGPAYLAGLNGPSGSHFGAGGNAAPPPPFERWGGGKTGAAVEPWYHRLLLIRGARIDAPGAMHFMSNATQVQDSLLIDTSGFRQADGSGSETFETLVPESGCYAIQLDGSGFSEVIVFRADFTPVP